MEDSRPSEEQLNVVQDFIESEFPGLAVLPFWDGRLYEQIFYVSGHHIAITFEFFDECQSRKINCAEELRRMGLAAQIREAGQQKVRFRVTQIEEIQSNPL